VLKEKLGYITIAIILAVILCFLLRGVLVIDKSVPESKIVEPPENTLVVDQEEIKPVKSLEKVEPSENTNRTDEVALKLAPQEVDYLSAARPDVDFSYSITKENKKRTILPGVTYQSGEGVNVKLDNEQETIQINRDSTYHNNQYQVLWKKKY